MLHMPCNAWESPLWCLFASLLRAPFGWWQCQNSVVSFAAGLVHCVRVFDVVRRSDKCLDRSLSASCQLRPWFRNQ